MILVNEVSMIRIDGANVITVKNSRILIGAERLPPSLLYAMEKPLFIKVLTKKTTIFALVMCRRVRSTT